MQFLKEFLDENSEEKKEVTQEIKDYLFDLAEVYLKMGDLEMCKSDYKASVDHYLKALKIRKNHDTKFSRAMAEIYFNLAKVYDFDSKKCLVSFIKAKVIMEYHIKKALIDAGKPELAEKIKIFENLLDEEECDYKNIKIKNECIETEEFKNANLSDKILDLASIIEELNQKV